MPGAKKQAQLALRLLVLPIAFAYMLIGLASASLCLPHASCETHSNQSHT